VDRPVAGALQPGREVVGEEWSAFERRIAEGRTVDQHPVVVDIEPGEQAGPRRAADRVGDVVAVEADAACGDLRAHVRHDRPAQGIAGVELLQGLVVGLDQDHVRRGRGSLAGTQDAGEQATKQEEISPFRHRERRTGPEPSRPSEISSRLAVEQVAREDDASARLLPSVIGPHLDNKPALWIESSLLDLRILRLA
jgi:hypothetical protein